MITIALLDRDQRAPYSAFTFPDFRPLLEKERPTPPAVFGARSGADPIGLSLGFAAPNRQFELISLYVSPLWRGQGIGARLLRTLEDHYRAQGCVLGAHFFTVNEDDQGFARFLMRQGWSRPAIRQVICRTTPERILASPLSAFARLPQGYRIVGWAEVTEAQKAAIRERRQCGPGWYPDELDPFRHERDCLIDTSIALLFGDAVVGWLFSHVLDENTLRMTCSFVSKELERSGRVLHLWWEAGVRQDRLTTLKRSIWTVPVAYGNHVRFVVRHVKPWMESFAYACTAIRRFDAPQAPAASNRS
ncbi:MAG: GNAT family N-acetyltransferase [Stellaceae bacterium]